MLRIGYVSYLNALPLICDLSQLAPGAQLLAAPPGRLADELAAGRLDVALAPIVEWFKHPEYQVVSDAAIACEGAVRSVMVFAKRPIAELESVILDPHSRTSNELLRIIFKQNFNLTPQYLEAREGEPLAPEQLAADACLVIGDRALLMEGQYPVTVDLGEEWFKLTGQPFVFACWLGRPGIDGDQLADALSEARDRGVARLATLAEEAAPRLGLSAALCRDYLRDNISFHLTSSAREGLDTFRRFWQDAQEDCSS